MGISRNAARISAMPGLIAAALGCAGCGSGPVEVSDPFYLWHTEDPDAPALFRCVAPGPQACAIDTLPDPPVLAAGANARYVVLRKPEGLYYFRRIPQERWGWGSNPEVIVGSLTEAGFRAQQAQLGLPEPDVKP